MNTLSWFLYAADVIGNVQGVLVLLGMLGGMAMGVLSVAYFVTMDGYSDKEHAVVEKALKPVLTITVFCVFVAALIPSKETIYLIAGSEAGETVVKSPEAQEILSDIKDVIKHQLNTLKGEQK